MKFSMEDIGARLEFCLIACIAVFLCFTPILFIAWLAHRVCRNHRWARVAALGFGYLYITAAIAPFAMFGAEGALFWSVLTMPFSLVLEIVAPIGFAVYALVATAAAACFWFTLVYAVCAIVIRLRGGVSSGS